MLRALEYVIKVNVSFSPLPSIRGTGFIYKETGSSTKQIHFISLRQLPKRKNALKYIYLRIPHIVQQLHGLVIPVMNHFEVDKSFFRKCIAQADIFVH